LTLPVSQKAREVVIYTLLLGNLSNHIVALNPRRQKAKQPRPTINHTFRDSVLFFSHQYYNRPQSTDEIVIEVAQWRFKIVLSNEEEQTIKMKEAVRRRRKS
jgi:hypothetical protein